MNLKLTLFSLAEANRMVEELTPELKRLLLGKRELDQLDRRIAILGLASSGAAKDNPDALELRQSIERRASLSRQIASGVQAIHQRGCLLKDLDQGLVDFYAVSGDRLIFLCWRLGEEEVSHWHSLEGGFSSRQPLNRSELE
jgi:hypothetical protein